MREGPDRVKSGNALIEHKISASPPKADVRWTAQFRARAMIASEIGSRLRRPLTRIFDVLRGIGHNLGNVRSPALK
jgi:hypothetical protein